MTKQEVLPIRFFLGLAALAALLIQLVVIPSAGASYASAYPEVAYLALPTVMALVVAVVGVEMAVVAAWQLVSAAVAGRTRTNQSTRWTNILTASVIFMAVLLAGVFAYIGSIASVGGPAMLFGLLASLTLIPVAFALRCWVRGWLRGDAVDDRIAEGRTISTVSCHAQAQ
ncbi:DUF2975 domain-containing protein [Arthrobacter roseus]|uniref:DUF2975 domain-containing protein n=1 Tax=Arthrobacter roseus TaxID=136274 RepID=UPI001965B2BE|nr:DUF2975 domain-containing protein [Arthrobacter roseus]MBM7847108.1 lysylphosphatidylglycerol synthetase-like protein (DUF2156 family) [Arthrobacter roseus]